MGVYLPVGAPFPEGSFVCDGDVRFEGLWHLPLVILCAGGWRGERRVPLRELKDGLSPKLDLISLNGWKDPVTWAYRMSVNVDERARNESKHASSCWILLDAHRHLSEFLSRFVVQRYQTRRYPCGNHSLFRPERIA